MPQSLFDADFRKVYDGKLFSSKGAFPSPVDWRDCVIYFLMLTVSTIPRKSPYTSPSTILSSAVTRAASSAVFATSSDISRMLEPARFGSVPF